VVIELIHLDCKTEKHTEQKTDGQNGKTNRKIFLQQFIAHPPIQNFVSALKKKL